MAGAAIKNFQIGPSIFESNQDVRFEFKSNLQAAQVPDSNISLVLAGDRLSSSDMESVATTTEAAVSEKIVNLGRRLGMNTDLRRSVFYAVITSDVLSVYFLFCVFIYSLFIPYPPNGKICTSILCWSVYCPSVAHPATRNLLR